MTTNPQAYAIAPLVWVKHGREWTAETILGTASVAEYARGWWRFSRPTRGCESNFRSLEAAQAAADAWHRERILPALIPVQPNEGEV